MQSVCYAWNCLDTHTHICHGLANVYVHTWCHDRDGLLTHACELSTNTHTYTADLQKHTLGFSKLTVWQVAFQH